MVLLVIFCVVVVAVVIYLAIMYYFLFCKEKSARDVGIFTVSDPDVYLPKEKKKNTTSRLAVAGLLIAGRKHKHESNVQPKDEKRPEAFKPVASGVDVENLNLEDEKKEPYCKEERSVHFEDQRDSCDDYHSNTYQRSDDVDHGYGTLSDNYNQGNSSCE